MDPSSETPGGIVDSVRRLLRTTLGLVQNRFQLFTVELQEEKIRLVDVLLRVAAVVVLGFLSLISATALVVVLFWETAPVTVLVIVTLGYALAAAGIGFSIKTRLHRAPPPFAGTLAEFKKDRECLGKPD
ncbi:MAG: hypothetical protein PCFJNLEI_00952 [Verrucomicrobiae bacterium]|nr:hypothetical protein [Verrucomicrobiae bacterium]